MKAISCEKLPRNWRSRTTLCTTPFTEQHKLALTRIEREVGVTDAGTKTTLNELYSAIGKQENAHPEAVLLVAGDFNAGKFKTPDHLHATHTEMGKEVSPSIWQIWP